MNGKTQIILLVILAIMGALVFTGSKMEDGGPSFDNKPFADLATEAIDTIVLTRDDEELIFNNSSGMWRGSMKSKALDFPASVEKLRQLIINISNITLIEQTCEGRSYDDLYELSKKKRPLKIELKAKGKVLALVQFGKVRLQKSEQAMSFMPPEKEGQYLRLSDDPIYLAKEAYNYTLSESDWVEKVLAVAPIADIAKIQIKAPHKSYTLTRESREIKEEGEAPRTVVEWVATGDTPENGVFNTNQSVLLENLSKVEIREPINTQVASKVKHPDYTVSVFGPGNKEFYTLNLEKSGHDWMTSLAAKPEEVFKMNRFDTDELVGKDSRSAILGDLTLCEEPTTVRWESATTKIVATTNSGQWQPEGDAPVPPLKTGIRQDLTKYIKNLPVVDFHVRDFPKPREDMRVFTVVDAEGKESKVTLLGESKLHDRYMIFIEGKKQAFSIDEEVKIKLFPEWEEIFNARPPVYSSEELDEIHFKEFKLLHDKNAHEWSIQQEGEADWVADKAKVDEWLKNYKDVFKSYYSPAKQKFPAFKSVTIVNDGKRETMSVSQFERGRSQASYSGWGGSFSIEQALARSLFQEAKFFKKRIETEESQ